MTTNATPYDVTADRLGELRAFTERVVAPLAPGHDRTQRVDRSLVEDLGRHGYLGTFLPEGQGGGWGFDDYTLLHEVLGTTCTATRSLVTVHDMVIYALWRWGRPSTRDTWLPELVAGTKLAAFALTEPESGDPARITTTATETADGYRLTGVKRYISFAPIADVLLVFARTGSGLGAFLVPTRSPGLTVAPIVGLLGARGSMLGEVRLVDVDVPAEMLVGRAGRARPQIVSAALTVGRLGVGAGAVGLMQGAFDVARGHAAIRDVAGGTLLEQQLIQRLLAEMITSIEAGRLLCREAGRLLTDGDPGAPMAAMIAKHFAATAASQATRDAVQILGAAGCLDAAGVERLFRDAKVMEVIEGGNEIQQMVIGKFGHTTTR